MINLPFRRLEWWEVKHLRVKDKFVYDVGEGNKHFRAQVVVIGISHTGIFRLKVLKVEANGGDKLWASIDKGSVIRAIHSELLTQKSINTHPRTEEVAFVSV